MAWPNVGSWYAPYPLPIGLMFLRLSFFYPPYFFKSSPILFGPTLSQCLPRGGIACPGACERYDLPDALHPVRTLGNYNTRERVCAGLLLRFLNPLFLGMNTI